MKYVPVMRKNLWKEGEKYRIILIKIAFLTINKIGNALEEPNTYVKDTKNLIFFFFLPINSVHENRALKNVGI